MLLTVVSFLVALAILIAVHEYGHYRVALACGVKVLRFSIGFGRPIWRRTSPISGTEFVVSALPLGGYVRMLDEREGPVDPAERDRAFNTQPLRARAAIVAAGPAANLFLAVGLYALVAWWGVQSPQPVLSTPPASSMAEQAGLRGGEWVQQLARGQSSPQPVTTFDDLRWQLTQAVLSNEDVTLWLASGPDAPAREVVLPLSDLPAEEADASMLQRVGVVAPWSAPEVGELMPGGAAESAGLLPGDLVRAVDGRSVDDAQQLRARIRSAADANGQVVPQRWAVDRNGRQLELTVTPRAERQGDVWVGRVGAYIGSQPAMVEVTAGALEGLWQGIERTWEVSALSLQMMFKMLVGEASLKNLGGPLTIADYAGKSASLGLTSYLLFLALISVSLGVLNLLPLPVLDGGHLMYYLWEAVTGRPVSDIWMERLQRGGVAVLFGLMSLAIFNDLARLLG